MVNSISFLFYYRKVTEWACQNTNKVNKILITEKLQSGQAINPADSVTTL